jgi:hypothetical protein
MADRRPLVIVNGQVSELPAGDTVAGVEGVAVTGVTLYAEPVVVAGFNEDAVHHTGASPIPLFVTTTDGDIITAGVR